jgi:hypothetical protein
LQPGIAIETMRGVQTQVTLGIEAGPDADQAELAELALALREDLRDVDLESVQLASGGERPTGAKSGDVMAWGTLVVGIASSGALTALINAVSAWITRQRSASVRLKIGDDELELTGASSDDQRRLIDAWLARRSAATRSDG